MKLYRHRRSGASRSPQQQLDPGNHVFESTSVKGKIRGTARQLVERYFQFAEEARLSNDRVASESFLQSAEHYTRIANPVRHTDTRPVKHQPYEPAPAATETRSSKRDTCIAVPSAAVCIGKAPAPEAVTVKIAPFLTSGAESKPGSKNGQWQRLTLSGLLDTMATPWHS